MSKIKVHFHAVALGFLVSLAACSRSSAGEAVPPAPSAQRLAPLAPVSASTGNRTVDSPEGPVSTACEKICTRSRELDCARQAQCMEGCLQMAGVPGCALPFEKLYSCLAAEPVAHWECAEDGMGAIRDGYCEKEQSAAASCAGNVTR